MYVCPWTQYGIQHGTQYETQYGNQRKKTKTKLVCGWDSSHAILVLVNWGEASLFFSGEKSMQAFIPGIVSERVSSENTSPQWNHENRDKLNRTK